MNTSPRPHSPAGLSALVLLCVGAGLVGCGGSGNGGSDEVPATAGRLELLAGTTDQGGAGSRDGAGTAARFNSPKGLAIDTDGNLYVADAGNAALRKITPDGRVTKLADTGQKLDFNARQEVAVGADGSVLVSGRQPDPSSPNGAQTAWLVRRLDGQGRLTAAINPLLTADMAVPSKSRTVGAMHVDRQGRLVMADYYGCAVGRAETPLTFTALVSSQVAYGEPRCGSTLFGTAYYGVMAMALDKDDNVHFTTGDGAIWRTSATGEATALHRPSVRPDMATGMAVDAAGTIYVAHGKFVRRLGSDGVASVLAGAAFAGGSDDGPGAAARFGGLGGLVVDGRGNVFVTDTEQHTVRKIDAAGHVTTLAGLATQYRHVDGLGAQARFGDWSWLAADAAGTVFVADGSTMTVRKIDRQGHVSTLAGKPGAYGTTDGQSALARFSAPNTVAVVGNQVVVGEGLRLRWIDAQGQVVSTGWSLGLVQHLAASDTGVLLAASSSFGVSVASGPDADLSLCTSPRHMPSRTSFWISRVAADGSITALFDQRSHPDLQAAGRSCLIPEGLAVDRSGSVYFTLGHAVFKRTPSGEVTLLAGRPDTPGSADGSTADARFNTPLGLAVAADGTLYVADSGNHTVRKIAPTGAVSTAVGRAGQAGILLGSLPAGLDAPYNVVVTPGGLVIRSKAAVLFAPL